MSEIVIRCPNCGTTQGALSECEACHEAEARYFCTNHTPGRWLDGPACAECGARFGVDRVATRPAPPPTRRPEPLGRRTIPIDEPARTIEEVWTGPIDTPRRAEVEEIGARDPRGDWPPPPPPFPPFGVRVVHLGGCVRRLIVLFIVLLALAALAFFGLLGVGSRLLFGAAIPASHSETSSFRARGIAVVPVESVPSHGFGPFPLVCGGFHSKAPMSHPSSAFGTRTSS